MPGLHPLVATLRRADLGALDAAGAKRIWKAAKEGGLTPAEATLMDDVFAAAGSSWDAATRSAWETARANADPTVSRPKGRAAKAVGAEDLTAKIGTFWLQGYEYEADKAYAADLALLAHEFGFKLLIETSPFVTASHIASSLSARTGLAPRELAVAVDLVRSPWDISPWGEDNKIVTGGRADGTGVVVTTPPTLTNGAIDAAELFTWTEGYHAFDYGFQGAVDARGEGDMAAATANTLGKATRTTKSYLEGGNILGGTSSDGRAFALVGRDSLVISAFDLRAKGEFSAADIASKRASLEMSGELDAALASEIAGKLAFVYDHSTGRRPSNAALVEEARDFAAILELTKEVIADDLGVPAKRAIFVTQPDFHIDMHMRPLQAGEIMVHHPRAALELLDEALAEPGLPTWERTELTQMRGRVATELSERGAMYDGIVKELEDAGMLVVPTGGVFESNHRHANFMNAVPFTAEDGTQVLATNASSLKSLERAFERRAKSLGVDEVRFLGATGGGRYSLSASEQSLEDFGALDCRQVDHPARVEVANDPLDVALGVAV